MTHTPKYDVASSWVAPAAPPCGFAGAFRVGIDVETCDPGIKEYGCGVRRGGYVCGVSLAVWESDRECAAQARSWYFPLRHEAGGNCQWDVLGWLRAESQGFTGQVCGANLPYDLDYLWSMGVEFPTARGYRDVQIAEPLIDELQYTYSLEDIARRRGFEGKDEAHLQAAARRWGLHPKGEIWKLPARHVGPYGELDALLPLKILEKQELEIGKQDLWRIYDLECRVLPVLLRMKRRGVKVDFQALERVETKMLQVEVECLAAVGAKTGVNILPEEIWEAGPVEKALRATGWTPSKMTATGKPCLDAKTLEGIPGEVPGLVKRARKHNKIRTTFAASVREHAVDGRIHCSLNQLKYQRDDGDTGGAAFGRLSCTLPNLQQQPARDEELGPLWREIYVPDEGKVWMSADYSAQEPRWAVHYADKVGAPGAREMVARYRANPKLDLHQAVADLAGIKRKDAKTIFLGLCYGMGGAKLCRGLGFPTEWKSTKDMGWSGADRKVEIAGPEGKAFLEKFEALVPFLKTLAKAASGNAGKNGRVVTAGGRACRFPPKAGGGYEWTHKALNRVIQGSSADQTKAALLMMDDRGLEPQLQVHDEIDASVPDRETSRQMEECMVESLPMSVPTVVDVEYGQSWGHSMKKQSWEDAWKNRSGA